MPLKVLILRDSSGVYGAERVILTLAKNINTENYQYLLCCLQGNNSNNTELIEAANSIGLASEVILVKNKFDIKAIYELRNFVKKNNFNIIHTHDFKSDFYAVFASLFTKVKIISTAHGSTRDSFIKKLYLFFTEYILYFFFERIIAVSDKVATSLCYKQKIKVIQNGIDPELIMHQSKDHIQALDVIPRHALVFGIIGRLFPDKGQLEFIEAFDRIVGTNNNMYALIVGDGPSRKVIQKKIADKGLEDRILLLGFQRQIKKVYDRLDFLVIPSFREGLPYTLLEAMSVGIPVIATSVGDIPQLIIPEETGVLIEPENIEAIEFGINWALNNMRMINEMKTKAKIKVADMFSAARMTRAVEELYSEITIKN